MKGKPSQEKINNFDDTIELQAVLPFETYYLKLSQRMYLSFKGFSDLFLATLGCLILLIPLLIVAILIRIDSPGPAIFSQLRIGKHGRIFKIYKFRTMYVETPPDLATSEVEDSDQYVTRIGRFLRKASIDELPQLLNVIIGDMSLIGPRPLIRDEADMDYLRRINGIYQLKPGITGLAQINGRDCIDIDQKIAFDRQYLKTVGFLTDLRIMLRTVVVVFKGKDVVF